MPVLLQPVDREDMVQGDANDKDHSLRYQADVEALRKGLKDGTIEVISTDHAPHSREEKSRSMLTAPFGIVGLETSVGSDDHGAG